MPAHPVRLETQVFLPRNDSYTQIIAMAPQPRHTNLRFCPFNLHKQHSSPDSRKRSPPSTNKKINRKAPSSTIIPAMMKTPTIFLMVLVATLLLVLSVSPSSAVPTHHHRSVKRHHHNQQHKNRHHHGVLGRVQARHKRRPTTSTPVPLPMSEFRPTNLISTQCELCQDVVDTFKTLGPFTDVSKKSYCSIMPIHLRNTCNTVIAVMSQFVRTDQDSFDTCRKHKYCS